uniref:Uncharacterized protein n=1 Tax=Brassica campestris TaxID=3711 RepID=M4CUB5_BRACM
MNTEVSSQPSGESGDGGGSGGGGGGGTSPTVKKMRGQTTCYSLGPNIGNNATDGAKRSLLKGVGPMVGV